MGQQHTRPALGAKVRCRGYMVRYSTMRAWRETNPDAGEYYPNHGVRGLKRRAAVYYEGVYVGIRKRKVKRWWVTDRGHPDNERWHSHDTYLTLWLVAYNHRANPRYVLPGDVEVLP